MENLKLIITIVSVAFAVLLFAVDVILFAFKVKAANKKLTPEEEAKVKELENLQDILTKTLPEAQILAEVSGAGSGAAKKLVALSQVMLECNKRGVDYARNSEVIEEQLERNMALTKKVNVK